MMESSKRMVLKASNRELVEWRDLRVHLLMDPKTVVGIVANLQLALRHPDNVGEAARVAREIIDQLITRLEKLELPATVALLRLGDDPESDI
jgi:hypothetical protein